jgi:hypothetical protein
MLRFKDWACTSRWYVGKQPLIIGGSVVERMWVRGDTPKPFGQAEASPRQGRTPTESLSPKGTRYANVNASLPNAFGE